MREIRKRLKQLEAKTRIGRPCTPPQSIESAALRRLSTTDRDLFRHGRTEGSEDTPEYKSMLVRFEAAYAAASRDAGVPYLDQTDRGWL